MEIRRRTKLGGEKGVLKRRKKRKRPYTSGGRVRFRTQEGEMDGKKAHCWGVPF